MSETYETSMHISEEECDGDRGVPFNKSNIEWARKA